ncbi:16S rRNA (cytidine(1402)-2'-O)-methyltransferase [Thermodesulfovibrio yellowstonii]|uniref:16S rRNA (cytidine(1402)-2'-O)-methyltransferase n=1 Tax=Thermodesulfovibrio yellowstonii TaxID=28262 RepID=UPI0024B3A131|nr:16S rRNA (cytidine(1402)-2'-O)-methyltransferase [Thermodesulfovibrio yellowstonii]MDI6865111.1 16S rRNA (cytidine(1402)-2'-O)-methyltransferase [Thermodesulfovibrio yellowstonii]
MSKGRLYIVSTPIGNLEDITLRALDILRKVDYIACEDTERSLKLLNYYEIKKPLISYWSEKEKVRAEEIIQKIKSGHNVALITDAGTPGISDPGAVVISRAIEEDIEIIPIPGPTALIAALSISGLNTEEFTFIGFLPVKQTQRRKKLLELSSERRTLVFYEAPHRILQSLDDMLEVLGDRRICVARELTKMFEEVQRGRLSEVLERLEKSKIAGEYVIVIEGALEKDRSIEEALKEVRELMKKGKGRKEAVKIVSELYGLSKKELYEESLKKDEI